MKKETLLAIAAAITAIANEIASAGGDSSPAPVEGGKDAEPTKRRGRPPTAEKAPETTPEPPAAAPAGKTYEELRELIKPLVEAGQGEEVKKLITKYGADILKNLDPKHHAAFEKDISALVL